MRRDIGNLGEISAAVGHNRVCHASALFHIWDVYSKRMFSCLEFISKQLLHKVYFVALSNIMMGAI